jgi:2-polyprenyl-6-hydroxyphenyl methylase/3-demethylubiquinone-9 3-methyltransferase
MNDDLPRLEGLSEPAKYERLVERDPDVWWSEVGPFVGLHELNVARVDYFRGVCGGFAGRRVLDVGCGGGILAESLAREGALVTGVDPSARSLEAARAHAAGSRLAIEYRLGTAEDLPAAGFAGTFDLVFAVDVLEHVEDLERSLAAIARLLAGGGGGALGFLTHNRTPAAFLQLIWAEEYVDHTMPEGFHEFRRFITPGELTDGLARVGLAVQEVRGLGRAEEGSGRRILTDDRSVTYIGWARKS